MRKVYILFCLAFTVSACSTSDNPSPATKTLSDIAIGSCCNQLLNMSIFKAIKDKKPDLYIAMGDNIYADNIFNLDFPSFLQSQYTLLANNYDFKTFRASVPCIATWDDHDYGKNNAGAEFPNKNYSKPIFLKFWNEPLNSDRWNHDGVYTSYMYGDEKHRLQIIVLDCRNFLNVISPEPIAATNDTTKTILGATQWAWLKQELMKPAMVRIVLSSTQMCTEHNGWEAWANYPHELDRFFQTVKDARADGVFVISGDVHYAEFSKRTKAGQYPIYDFTSSGLTHIENVPAANQYRVGDAYNGLNFGMIHINWEATPVTVNWEVCDNNGNVKRQLMIPLDELKF